jgi:hypothetical protein
MQVLTEYHQIQLPNQLLESYEPGKPMMITGVVIQRSNAKNRNGRVYPADVLRREIDKYNDTMVKSNRALGELDHSDCFCSPEFEVLTESGWKKFSDLSIGENVLSVNPNNRLYEYKPILGFVNAPYSGDAYEIKGRNIDTKITPNHKFLLEDRHGNLSFHTIEEIHSNRKKFNKHKIIKSGIWDTPKREVVLDKVEYRTHSKKVYVDNIAVDSKVLAGIVGIWLAEGHTKKHKKSQVGQVCITQKEGNKCEEIISLLDKSPFSYRVSKKHGAENTNIISIKDHRLYNYLNDLGNKYTKCIPQEIKNLDSESLTELLYFYNVGDGRNQINCGRERMNVFTVSPALIGDLQECQIKTGNSGNITIAHKAGSGNGVLKGRKIIATTDLYQLELSKMKGIYLDDRFIKIEKTTHEGGIYCLEVQDNHTFCVRQKGKFFISGNSNVVNLKNVSHNIKKIYWKGDDVCGDIEILDGDEFPAGRIAAGLLRRGIPVGISSRGMGSVHEGNDGTVTVNDDFNLLTFDLVSFESTQGANLTLREGYEATKTFYNNIDRIVKDLICNNTGVCHC